MGDAEVKFKSFEPIGSARDNDHGRVFYVKVLAKKWLFGRWREYTLFNSGYGSAWRNIDTGESMHSKQLEELAWAYNARETMVNIGKSELPK